MTKASIFIRISLAVALFVTGVYLYGKFVPWFLIHKPGVTYISNSVSGQFKYALFFSLCLAFVPIGSLLLNLKKGKNILIASLFFFFFLVLAILVKRFFLATNIKKYHSGQLFNDFAIEHQIPLEKALPEIYMFISLMIGFTIFWFLKEKRILFKHDSDNIEELVFENK